MNGSDVSHDSCVSLATLLVVSLSIACLEIAYKGGFSGPAFVRGNFSPTPLQKPNKKLGPWVRPITTPWSEWDEKAESTIQTYLEARKHMSRKKVVEEIFNTSYEAKDPYPFFSANTLVRFADHVVEDPRQMQPGFDSNLQDGDVIFVKTAKLDAFIEQLLPNITHQFILVSHYGDLPSLLHPIQKQLLEDERLIHWFAKNGATRHHKVTHIPIGLSFKHFMKEKKTVSFENALRLTPPFYQPVNDGSVKNGALKQSTERNISAYLNYSRRKGSFRDVADKMFKEYGTFVKKKHSPSQYYQDVARSKFVVSPPGLGEDCYRTWEAVLLRAIPIVRSTSMNTLYRKGPILIVHSYDLTLPEVRLLEYRVPTTGRKLAMADYWLEQINAAKRRYLEGKAARK